AVPPSATAMQDIARRGLAAIADTAADHMHTAGESFLATVARYGTNGERRIAAFGNHTAARLTTPTCSFLARYMALEALANGVCGPIGAALADLGRNAATAMAEYSKDDALVTAQRAMQVLHLAESDADVSADSRLAYRLTALEVQPR